MALPSGVNCHIWKVPTKTLAMLLYRVIFQLATFLLTITFMPTVLRSRLVLTPAILHLMRQLFLPTRLTQVLKFKATAQVPLI